MNSKQPRREDEHIASAGGTVFEGIVSLRALLDGGYRRIEKVLLSGRRAEKYPKEAAFLRAKAAERGFTLELTDDGTLNALATGNTHGGLLAVCGERVLPASPDALPENGRGFLIYLDGVEDPYNFGYALRSIYAAGADAVLLPERSWMTAAGIVCRASAGASERMTLITAADPAAFLGELKSRGYRIVCGDIENSVSAWDAELKLPLVLVVGGERRGISAQVRALCDGVVRLDYGRPFDAALSAASAVSILAFEVLRQNRDTFGLPETGHASSEVSL